MFTIKATKREAGVKLDTLKHTGELPAVFYGMGKTSTAIAIPIIEFKKIWSKAGESSTVTLDVEGHKVDTLIHEVQVHPVTDEPIHVDFLAIDINKKIKVNVSLEFIGVSNAVKGGLGSLVKVLHEVEIEALPKELPHNLSVDISKLETINDKVLVSDIALPAGVVMITDTEEVVASIAVQKEEVEDTTPVDLSAIEVEKKGKKEEEAAPAE